jgi:predicted RNA binding protein YcfA (HicA-like mRNA interferase family)
MSAIPRVSGRDCVKALRKKGYEFIRQKGSHMIIRRTDPFSQITVPDQKELDRGTLRAILRQASLSVDEFNELR